MSAGQSSVGSSSVPGPWRVFRASNAESVRATGIPNPRDVTMDSADTEDLLGFKFVDLREVVPVCVKEIQRLLSAELGLRSGS